MSGSPHEIDTVTGTRTTGHSWDGIKELNTPLPRWWLWVFYATIIWSIGYVIVYPAIPLVSSHTAGLFGWNQRASVETELAALQNMRGATASRVAEAPLEQILADPELLAFARAQAKPLFAENCAPCHGSGAAGAKGYPNLNDDEWIWGGKLADIHQTLTHGIRVANNENTRSGEMPAFGRDGILKRPEVTAVSEYVRKIAGLPTDAKADLALGGKVFEENCAACHGDQGKGNQEVGAPNLTDSIWLYAPDAATIAQGVWNGRGAVMPSWSNRLDPAAIKALTVYVHSLGGGQK